MNWLELLYNNLTYKTPIEIINKIKQMELNKLMANPPY